MQGAQKPTRRVWQVMDWAGNMLIYWLASVLVCAAIEGFMGSFSQDPFQTYTFVSVQIPFMSLVIYASQCIWNIGYHLMVLEDCNEASRELNQ